MDYLCRDQFYTGIEAVGGAFGNARDVDQLLQHARVAAVRCGGDPGFRTEISFLIGDDRNWYSESRYQQHRNHRRKSPAAVELLDGLFSARATMHELCYQCECGSSKHRSIASTKLLCSWRVSI